MRDPLNFQQLQHELLPKNDTNCLGLSRELLGEFCGVNGR